MMTDPSHAARGTAERLWALDAPTITTEAANLVMGADGVVTIPMPAFVIQHERALVMFDTGFAPLLNDDPYAYFGERADLLKVRTHPGQRIDHQLSTLGFDVEDVTHVVLSHVHSDHAGGISFFPKARFIVGEGEFDWARDPDPHSARHIRWAEELEPALGYDWTTVTGDRFDVLGDGSLVVIPTPGHTPGHLSLLVRLPSQTFVLTGDAAHLRSGLDTLQPDPYDWNLELAQSSMRKLVELEASGVRLWITHDPGDWEAFEPLRPQS